METTTEPEWLAEVLHWHEPSTTLPFIYTAPENMRLADRADPIFEPVLVSIGPFHRGKFPATEEHKIRILKSMLDRLYNRNKIDRRELLIKLADVVREVEEIARECYSKSFRRIDFVKMMVFDGCFILEIFRMHARLYDFKYGDDPIFKARWMLPALALDIVKLENQLPYFVLNVLYQRTKLLQEPTLNDIAGRLPEEPTLNELAGSFLDLLRPGLNRQVNGVPGFQHHLLSLFHSTFDLNRNLLCSPTNKIGKCLNSLWSVTYPCIYRISTMVKKKQGRNLEGNRLNSFASVTDLSLSGIKVVKKKQEKSLLDIEYNNGGLEIPNLVIDHNTKILMSNLVAYEQCDEEVPDIFTSYVTFLDALVNSAEDVELLRKAGVINHFMNNNKDVCLVLNDLTANIKYNMYTGYLAELNAEIYHAHHIASARLSSRFKRLISSRENTISLIIAFVGFYLAALQTVFTVLAYVQT